MGTKDRITVDRPSEQFEDEFGPYLEEAKREPAFRAAFEDAEELHRLLDSLVGLRRALKLSQSAVAKRMGVGQPTVSGFETEGSDPRLSTLQRYARAVEARLRLRLEWPAECDWVSSSTAAYARLGRHVAPATSAGVTKGSLAREWREIKHADSERWKLSA
jgi:transcriptional regulator with XRE-family HTH domain